MRIIGKAIMTTFRENIVDSVGSLQVSCCSYDEKISYEDDTEAVLIIDASNVFNVVNKTTFLHNVQVVGPEISVYVRNCSKSKTSVCHPKVKEVGI